MTFAEAVFSLGVPLAAALRNGKRALGNKAGCIECDNPSRFAGSIDLDTALQANFPNDYRWDYGIGFRQSRSREAAIWVEIHPASEGEVETVLRKLSWLKVWLRESAPVLNALTVRSDGSRVFYWVATSGVSITPKSRKAKLLQQAGLDLPRQRWHLD